MDDADTVFKTEHEPTAKKAGRKRQILLAIKVMFSIALLVAVVLKVRPSIPSITSVDWQSIGLATGLLLIQPALLAVRWRLILGAFGEATKFFPLLQATWVSVLAGQFLPASVGSDLVRIAYLRSEGGDLGRIASSVVVDRAVALVGIAVLAVFSCPLLFDVGDPSMVYLTAGFAGVGMLCVPLLAVLAAPVERRAAKHKWLMPLAVLLHYVRIFMSRPAVAFGSLSMALTVHALSVAALYVIAEGLGIVVDAVHLIGISVVIIFAMAMPISIGGWGVREAVAVTLLGFFAVPDEKALLAAIVLGVCYAAASLPGGLIWTMRQKRRSETVA